MNPHSSVARAALDDLVTRGFSRRQVLRAVAMAGAAAALPLGSEPALAQLSGVEALPADAVKINANEFPEGPSTGALAALTAAAQQGNRYQYPRTGALVGAAAVQEGLQPEHFAVYPGSSLALHHAVIGFTSPTRALVVADPGYEAAALAATFIGAPVVRVPLRGDGAHDLPAMLAAARTQPVGLFYVCNPNNPTGTVTPPAEIDALVAAAPPGSVVLLDEAYIHLSDEPRRADLVRAGKAVVLLRTFSKIYGMAGLRAGFAIGRPDLLARMTGWNSGAMPATAMAAALVALGETELIAARKRANAARRADLMRFFDAHDYRYTPSVANHLMVDARRPTVEVIEALKQRHVYVGRPWPVWPTHVRITVGSAADMERFKREFVAVVVRA
jgi:histidinol-phosphate aminotransferase